MHRDVGCHERGRGPITSRATPEDRVGAGGVGRFSHVRRPAWADRTLESVVDHMILGGAWANERAAFSHPARIFCCRLYSFWGR